MSPRLAGATILIMKRSFQKNKKRISLSWHASLCHKKKIVNLGLKSSWKKVVIEIDLIYSKSYFKYFAVVCNYLVWFVCLFTVQILIHFICNRTSKFQVLVYRKCGRTCRQYIQGSQFSTFSLCQLTMH